MSTQSASPAVPVRNSALEVFKLDEKEGYAIVINQGGADPDKIQEAMDNCPTECIHWEEL